MEFDPMLRTHPTGLIIIGEQDPLGAAIVRQGFRSGRLTRVAHGYYIRKADRPRHEENALKAAAAGLTHTDAIVTGPGAAALLGIDHLYPPDLTVDLLSPRVHGSVTTGISRLIESRGNVDSTLVNGIRISSPARTAIESALRHGARSGVVAAESALWTGRCTSADIAAEAEKVRGRKGAAVARFVAEFAGDRSQSAGESLTALCIHHAGLPEPLQQVEIFDERGKFVAKVDFFWPELGVVIEFDGEVKLSGKYGDPETIAHRRMARDARLTNLGIRPFHVNWSGAFSGSCIPDITGFYEHFQRFNSGYIGRWQLADLTRR